MNTELNPNIETIVGLVDTGAAVARVLMPRYTAYIVLGAALARSAPALYEDVLKLVSKAEPTPQDKADLALKLHALAHPESA